MKMIVITSVKEDLQLVAGFLKSAAIEVFSVSDTVGHKSENAGYSLQDWYGAGAVKTDALFFFSFTDDDKAYHALHLIREYNQQSSSAFPVRAFVLPVETSTNHSS